MATEQTDVTEAIVQAVTETASMQVQAMAVARAENKTRHEGTQHIGPKVVGTCDETSHIHLESRR